MKLGSLTTLQLLDKLDMEISPDLINYLAKKGRIPAEKNGSRWNYRLSDVRTIRKIIREHLGPAEGIQTANA